MTTETRNKALILVGDVPVPQIINEGQSLIIPDDGEWHSICVTSDGKIIIRALVDNREVKKGRVKR